MPASLFPKKRHNELTIKNLEHVALLYGAPPAQSGAIVDLRKARASDLTRVLTFVTKAYGPHPMPQGLVGGIVAVHSVDGEKYIDHQNDHLSKIECRKMVESLLRGKTFLNFQHAKDADGKSNNIGRPVEAAFLDRDFSKRTGIPLPRDEQGRELEAVYAVFKIENPAVLNLLRQGAPSLAFSIGGSGIRVPVEKKHMATIDKQARVSKAREMTAQLIAKARRQLDDLASVIEKSENVPFATAWSRAAARNPELYSALKALGGFAVSVGDAAVAKAGRDYSDGKSGGPSYGEGDRVGVQDGSATVDPDNTRSYAPEDMADYYAADDVTQEAGDRIYYNTDADSDIAKSKLDAAADRYHAIEGITREQAFLKACREDGESYRKWRAAGGGMTQVGGKK
jgi:hypothetical protein